MLTPADEQIARRCALLRGLTPAEITQFLTLGREYAFAAGNYLFQQDDPADLLYILLGGIVRLSQLTPEGHQVIVHHVTPGEGIGIIVALSHMPYPVSAEALEAARVLAWDAATTRQMMLHYPQLAINGMEMLARHFVQISDRYRELATERVERRIAHALLRLVRQVGRRVDEGVLIDLQLSRQDLAEMTGTTLYTTSRILSQWEREGLILARREQVVVVQRHAIVAIAEDLPPPDQRDDEPLR